MKRMENSAKIGGGHEGLEWGASISSRPGPPEGFCGLPSRNDSQVQPRDDIRREAPASFRTVILSERSDRRISRRGLKLLNSNRKERN
jgi:hypothetical protein